LRLLDGGMEHIVVELSAHTVHDLFVERLIRLRAILCFS
jgi:hypothetical protein